MTLPARYADLAKEGGPKILLEGLALYGIAEKPGAANNPVILEWAKETGLDRVYRHDATAWCGLWMAVVAKRAGWTVVKDPLWALNWKKWEAPSPQPMLGDVLVFVRPGGGHVGLCVGEDATAFHVLGGNTSDKVTIARIEKGRLVAARRARWKIAQPPQVRVIVRAATGALSTNEA